VRHGRRAAVLAGGQGLLGQSVMAPALAFARSGLVLFGYSHEKIALNVNARAESIVNLGSLVNPAGPARIGRALKKLRANRTLVNNIPAQSLISAPNPSNRN